jgi:HNH endonuclease
MFKLEDCIGEIDLAAFSRFISKIQFTDTCWIWQGTIDSDGYGVFHLDRKLHKAHRIAFLWQFGWLPDYSKNRLQLDHVCRVRCCVRPLHLEQVSVKENAIRGKKLIVECPKGHEYKGPNLMLYINNYGGIARGCLKCRRECSAKHRKLKKCASQAG